MSDIHIMWVSQNWKLFCLKLGYANWKTIENKHEIHYCDLVIKKNQHTIPQVWGK